MCSVIPSVLVALIALTLAPSASAATSYVPVGSFGNATEPPTSTSAAPGEFASPQRIATDLFGDVFVADTDNDRVQVFKAAACSAGCATYVTQIPIAMPIGVAVDPTDGDLYVSHLPVAAVNEEQRINGFAESGTYELSFEGQSTGALPFNADAAMVQGALETLPGIGPGGVEVTDAAAEPEINKTVVFLGLLAGTDVPELVAEGEELGGSVSVETSRQGVAGGVGGIAKYDPDDPSDPTSYSPDPTFASPAEGPEPGEVGSFGIVQKLFGFVPLAAFGGIAVDPTVDSSGTHDILLADPAKNLVERFDSEGTFISSFDGSESGTPVQRPPGPVRQFRRRRDRLRHVRRRSRRPQEPGAALQRYRFLPCDARARSGDFSGSRRRRIRRRSRF